MQCLANKLRFISDTCRAGRLFWRSCPKVSMLFCLGAKNTPLTFSFRKYVVIEKRAKRIFFYSSVWQMAGQLQSSQNSAINSHKLNLKRGQTTATARQSLVRNSPKYAQKAVNCTKTPQKDNSKTYYLSNSY